MRTKFQTRLVLAVLGAAIAFGIAQGFATAVDCTAIFLGVK